MFLGAVVEMFLRLFFGVILVTSGWSKLRGGVPVWAGLGLVEAAVGLAVLSGAALPLAAPVLLALLLAFTAYLYRAWRKQSRKRCNCGGVLGDAVIGQAILLRNGVLAAAALVLWLLVADGGSAVGVGHLLQIQSFGGSVDVPAAAWGGTAAGLILAAAGLGVWVRFRPREEG